MKVFAVLNPAAGGGRASRIAGPMFRMLRDAGMEVEVAETERPSHASNLAKGAVAAGFRRVVAVGGDGTTFETLNGLFPRPDDTPEVALGVIPVGTGNSFLRDFGIRKPEEAVRAIVEGRERRIDVIRVTHRDGQLHYLNLLSLGFPAEVATLTNSRFKRLGAAGYVAAVFSRVAALRPCKLPFRRDEGRWERDPCTFVAFSNSRFTAGGMMMAPNADASDGVMDVIRVAAISRWTLVRAFPSIFRGDHLRRPDVSSAQASAIELEVPPLDVMVDGEVLRLQLQRLTVLPRALTLLA